MSKIVATTKFSFTPENMQAGKELLLSFVGPSSTQEGCEFYNVYQDNEKHNEFLIVDGWDSPEHLQQHIDSDEIVAIVAQIDPLLTQPKQLSTFTQIS
ncbi:hypothetical protein AM493_19995 [Flavobacterium akiainvivens]|uniref:ABM domain-containing protein n=1 Tax=Flavobacterium akiainvivens TaxID=1202724 RepID=A0A0M8MC35_9FLAO|nr:putative quinol monooxygenase [Flavobacterium akiainvivens]KOS08073.1 hypothetical protein AM493_19995 [Flavobacterium akiainvivens]SFQ71561.1 Quinol monooxygenase YgiN [Flavobacterium akiainvivens]